MGFCFQGVFLYGCALSWSKLNYLCLHASCSLSFMVFSSRDSQLGHFSCIFFCFCVFWLVYFGIIAWTVLAGYLHLFSFPFISFPFHSGDEDLKFSPLIFNTC